MHPTETPQAAATERMFTPAHPFCWISSRLVFRIFAFDVAFRFIESPQRERCSQCIVYKLSMALSRGGVKISEDLFFPSLRRPQRLKRGRFPALAVSRPALLIWKSSTPLRPLKTETADRCGVCRTGIFPPGLVFAAHGGVHPLFYKEVRCGILKPTTQKLWRRAR